jgi:hypothetical protein
MVLIFKILKTLILTIAIGLIFLHTGQLGADNRVRADLLKDQKAVNVSGQMQMGATSGKEAPLMLRNISVKFEPAGHEKVFMEFNRDVTPDISSIRGKDPRIVIDIKNVLSIRQGLKIIEVQGKLVRQIRSNLDHASRQLRIVVDLAPSRHYDIEPVFYKAEKIYMIDITEISEEEKR